MAYERRPAALGDFIPGPGTSSDDRMKISLEEGECLFAAMASGMWIVTGPIPDSLAARMTGRFDVPVIQHAAVGSVMTILVQYGSVAQKRLRTVYSVLRVEPCQARDCYKTELTLQ